MTLLRDIDSKCMNNTVLGSDKHIFEEKENSNRTVINAAILYRMARGDLNENVIFEKRHGKMSERTMQISGGRLLQAEGMNDFQSFLGKTLELGKQQGGQFHCSAIREGFVWG